MAGRERGRGLRLICAIVFRQATFLNGKREGRTGEEGKPIKEGKRGGGSTTAHGLNFTYGRVIESMNPGSDERL